jgi:hypothetical protein
VPFRDSGGAIRISLDLLLLMLGLKILLFDLPLGYKGQCLVVFLFGGSPRIKTPLSCLDAHNLEETSRSRVAD